METSVTFKVNTTAMEKQTNAVSAALMASAQRFLQEANPKDIDRKLQTTKVNQAMITNAPEIVEALAQGGNNTLNILLAFSLITTDTYQRMCTNNSKEEASKMFIIIHKEIAMNPEMLPLFTQGLRG